MVTLAHQCGRSHTGVLEVGVQQMTKDREILSKSSMANMFMWV
jgi:hypothetical protein